MIRFFITSFYLLCASAHAIDYTQLSAIKRLTAEKRYDEAIPKLEALATKTQEPNENAHYLDLAIDIAIKSLKNADRALALAGQVKDTSYRDFAKLRVLADFKRYDEALVSVSGKNLDAWPERCRGQGHGILASIHHAKKDQAAELKEWQLAAAAPGTDLSMRGRAYREAGVLQLKLGNPTKAEEQFRAGLALTPANYAWRVETLISLSRLLIEKQRPKDAVKAFDGTDFTKVTSLTTRGNLIEAYARALLAAGKKIKAIETFDQLLTLDLPSTWKERINQELDQMAEDF